MGIRHRLTDSERDDLTKDVDDLDAVYMEKLRKDGYEIYNLLDRNQPELYVADPAEFVYLMSKASLFR